MALVHAARRCHLLAALLALLACGGGGSGASRTPIAPGCAPAADEQATFASDWAADPIEGGWEGIQVVDPARLRRDPGTSTWHGHAAARVEVRPGDDPLHLGAGTERAEVLGLPTPEGAASGTQYFAFSYLLPAGWDSPRQGGPDEWAVVLQLHGPDALHASPVFALDAAQGGWEVVTYGGNLDEVSPPYPVRHPTAQGALALGRWTDFVARVRFASDETGELTLWRRDEGTSGFTRVLVLSPLATLQYSRAVALGPHYWKQGLYREAYAATNVLWMGPLVRATTFAAAEGAAFGTCDGAP